jgi:OOP family OmpA-OmpF porin
MRKLSFLAAGLLLSTVIHASDYKYEATPLVGMVFPEGNLQLDDQFLVGGEIQINNLTETIKPELQILHSLTTDYQGNDATTAITRFTLNGVYEFDTQDSVIPFAKMGLGYETVYYRYFDDNDSPYAAAAAGIKVPFAKQFALKLETQYMLYNKARFDNNLAMMVGITYSFGEIANRAIPQETKAEPQAVTSAPAVVAPVVAKMPTPKDSDNDGVIDSKDECKYTLKGVKVDERGCAKTFKLNINFGHDSDVIPTQKRDDIEKLAKFLKDNPYYNMTIVGHTDSQGSDVYNLKLSKKRANSLKSALIDMGIDSKRITASGVGETSPIASNKTEEGRKENRRLELTFIQ